LGDKDAVVTIIEYGDYACEGCAYWHDSGILESILERYDGQVKFVWRDNARLSYYSKDAAMAGQCAYDQGADAFWAYQDLLFENPTGFGKESLKRYADQIGLDRDQFDQCLDSDQYYKKVLHNLKQAGEFGLSFTPAFTINDKIVIGPPAESVMVEMIEEILAKK
jgi:protein-disulfide isomerase